MSQKNGFWNERRTKKIASEKQCAEKECQGILCETFQSIGVNSQRSIKDRASEQEYQSMTEASQTKLSRYQISIIEIQVKGFPRHFLWNSNTYLNFYPLYYAVNVIARGWHFALKTRQTISSKNIT